MLKNTDTLDRAIDNQSLNDAHQALVELHDDIQEYEVDDDAYEEVLKDVDALLEELEARKGASIKSLPNDVASQLADLTHRIESLYLRSSGDDTTDEKSNDQLREERDLYREKLREFERKLRKLTEELESKKDRQKDALNEMGEYIQESKENLEEIKDSEIPDMPEPSPRVKQELEKDDDN